MGLKLGLHAKTLENSDEHFDVYFKKERNSKYHKKWKSCKFNAHRKTLPQENVIPNNLMIDFKSFTSEHHKQTNLFFYKKVEFNKKIHFANVI